MSISVAVDSLVMTHNWSVQAHDVQSETDANQLNDHSNQTRHSHAQQIQPRGVGSVDKQAEAERYELQEAQPRAEEALPIVCTQAEE